MAPLPGAPQRVPHELWSRAMSTAYDPKKELNPSMLIAAVAIFTALAFGVVAFIILSSEASSQDGAAEQSS